MLLFITCSIPTGSALAIEDSILKAAFIEKLTRFIEWPHQTDSSKNAPFIICVIGEDTLNGALNELANITKVKKRRLVINYLQQVDDINGCNSLFISSTPGNQLSDVLKHITNRPILTIADSEGYASQGVMINFFFEDGRLRFEINHQAAKNAGIKVGARVLKLARIVE